MWWSSFLVTCIFFVTVALFFLLCRATLFGWFFTIITCIKYIVTRYDVPVDPIRKQMKPTQGGFSGAFFNSNTYKRFSHLTFSRTCILRYRQCSFVSGRQSRYSIVSQFHCCTSAYANRRLLAPSSRFTSPTAFIHT